MLLGILGFEPESAVATAAWVARILAWWTLASVVAATAWSIAMWDAPRDD